MNGYNCEVTVLAKQYQLQGRVTNIVKSKKKIGNGSSINTVRSNYIDVSLAYINFSGMKCETKSLFLKQQKFKSILTCKWHSEYFIETEQEIISR
jgi:hypothetical protein